MEYDQDSGWNNFHLTCKICGNPPCHAPCNPSEDNEDFEATMAAAALGDRATLLDRAAAGSSWIAFNEERLSLVVLGCDRKGLVAHLPLSRREAEEASRLVESGTLRTAATALQESARAGPHDPARSR